MPIRFVSRFSFIAILEVLRFDSIECCDFLSSFLLETIDHETFLKTNCFPRRRHITCQPVSQSDIYLICKEVHNMDFQHFLLLVCSAGNGTDMMQLPSEVPFKQKIFS